MTNIQPRLLLRQLIRLLEYKSRLITLGIGALEMEILMRNAQ